MALASCRSSGDTSLREERRGNEGQSFEVCVRQEHIEQVLHMPSYSKVMRASSPESNSRIMSRERGA